MSSVLGQVGQTRPGRLSEQPALTAQSAATTAASQGVAGGSPQQEVQRAIHSNRVVQFSKLVCPKCSKAKQVLKGLLGEGGFTVVELDQRPDGPQMQDVLEQMTGSHTVPRIFVNSQCIGGADELDQLEANGQLAQMLKA